jgi:hypothetical protein
MTELDILAKALYDACPTVKPDWDQLGETTKDVWRERILSGLDLV